jgi:hypothetical protein
VLSEITKNLLICLTASHLVGDFLLQPNDDTSKNRSIPVLIKHSGILAVLSYVFCGLWAQWEIPLSILATHYIIDFLNDQSGGKEIIIFIIDQITHLGVILGISFVLPIKFHPSVSVFWGGLLGNVYYKFLIFTGGAIITINGGSRLIGLAVKPFLDQLEKAKKTADSAAVKSLNLMSRGFENGGRIIGQLERALIFLFIMVNQPSAVGFLIAAKSILRFGEIKDKENRMEAEYIIIGTLMSFLFAIAFAYITKYLVDLI